MQISNGSKFTLASVALVASALFTSAQAATNVAPTISGMPATTAKAGKAYSFQPTARDANGDDIWFWVTGKPAWATLDPKTGRLSGMPSKSDVGVHEDIQIVAWDGKAAAKLPKFDITVAAEVEGRAPTISGAPATSATVNQTYSFKPAAFDMDGDSLVFSVTDKPSWATLNKKTGELSGKPTQVAVFQNIEISVTDGATRTKLPKFRIAVNPATTVVTKSVALSWTAPTQNTDGSALTNLTGYRVVYGPSSGNYTQNISVNTVGVTSYVVEDLKPGKYCFAVMARNSNGVESVASAEISVQL